MADGSQPLSQQVAEQLYDIIVRQQRYLPGQRIPDERSLSKELGVSRTSLREAIRLLIAEGVLVVRRGVGTFVTENPRAKADPFGFSCTEDKQKLLEDWYQVRLILEPEAMEIVTANATDEELQAIAELAGRGAAIVSQLDLESPEDRRTVFSRMDREFHMSLANATHSSVLCQLLPALHDWAYFGVETGVYPTMSPQMERNALESHFVIAQLLLKRDGKGAGLAMRYHLSQTLADFSSDT